MNGNLIQENESVDIMQEVRYYTFFWPWFLFSIISFVFCSLIYLRYSTNTYSTSATLQVKDAKSDPSSFLTQSAGAMFNFNRVKIDNYISQIISNSNINKVVDLLDLQTQVYSVGRVKSSLNFGDEIPFKINFTTDKIFKDGITLKFNDSNISAEFDGKFYDLGDGTYFEFDDFNLELLNYDNDTEFLVKNTSEKIAGSSLLSNIVISSSSKEGDNIDINIKGPNIRLNEAILNTLIKVAHETQVYEKRQIYDLSINFINGRLISIIDEIDSLSLETTGFKSQNLIFSPEAQTSNALLSLNQLEQEKFNLSTQFELAKSLKNNLNSQSDFSLLPSNIGINSGDVNELVVAYNTIVLKRNELLSGATLQNPLVVQLSLQLTSLKQNILSSIDNYIENIQTSISKFNEFQNSTSSQVSRIPELEARLLEFQRKFELSENLYLFLLQRREEASISYESTLPDTRVINYANSNIIPVSPKRNIIFLGSILLGLLVPFAILYTLKSFDNKIHTREDLEKISKDIQLLGEVPFVEELDSIGDSRGVFAESSRIIRSNLNYKIDSSNNCNVILCTSSIKGEGKTVTAINLTSTYVAADKKVLLIGGDLRNPQLHNVFNVDRKSTGKGLSNLIVDKSSSINDYITKQKVFGKQFDVLYSGVIPPNPAELLGSDNFKKIITDLKLLYDYIIIDSAPLMLVGDTYELIQSSDIIVYTLRSGYTDKKIIPFIYSLIEDKKVENIGFVLNSIKLGPKSYYKYGYSYRYSYQYKYNYGYGYGYGEDKS
ncbi:MAG: GumC family protein [Flavobacteriaceae bacterium]